MLKRRYIGFLGIAWCLLFFISMIGASGVLRPVAFGMTIGMSGTFLPRDAGGRTNVLLLGVGDSDHQGADLTDSLIVVSIEPRTQSIVLLSLPRDLYLADAPKAPDARINALYANTKYRLMRGGLSQTGASVTALRETADVLGEKLGMTIHGVIKVDFTAFREIIDAFGGIDIDVPEAIVDFTYPTQAGSSGVFSLDAGLQHLDGDMALRYARSRHSTSDFDRSARQQLILRALLTKAAEHNVLENFDVTRSIVRMLPQHAEWTFSSHQLIALAGAVVPVPRENILSMQLNTSVGSDYSLANAGGFVVVPSEETEAGAILLPYSLSGNISDWGQIRTLASLLFEHRMLYFSSPTMSIIADTRTRLAAHRLRNELVRYGFSVSETLQHSDALGSGALVSSQQGITQKFLSQYLSLPVTFVDTMESSLLHIVLPRDYRFVPLEKVQDLLM